MKRIILSIIILGLNASVLSAQKISDEQRAAINVAISYAQSIAYVKTDIEKLLPKSVLDPQLLANLSFVSYVGDKRGVGPVIDSKDPLGIKTKVSFFEKMYNVGAMGENSKTIAAGSYTLQIPRNGSIFKVANGLKKFEVDTMTVKFEPGKYYSINCAVDNENKIEFSIKETDIEPYLAYQRANPNHLDGVWSSAKKTISTSYSNHFTINGDNVKCEGDATLVSKKPYLVEGTLMYNENTIIIFPDKVAFNGKEDKNAIYIPYIWHYTLNGDELRLESDRQYPSWGNSGIYQKAE